MKNVLPNEACWLLFLVNPPAECVIWWQTDYPGLYIGLDWIGGWVCEDYERVNIFMTR